jgi:hypothetical protein
MGGPGGGGGANENTYGRAIELEEKNEHTGTNVMIPLELENVNPLEM